MELSGQLLLYVSLQHLQDQDQDYYLIRTQQYWISSLANDVDVVDAAGAVDDDDVGNYVAVEDVVDIIVNYEN